MIATNGTMMATISLGSHNRIRKGAPNKAKPNPVVLLTRDAPKTITRAGMSVDGSIISNVVFSLKLRALLPYSCTGLCGAARTQGSVYM